MSDSQNGQVDIRAPEQALPYSRWLEVAIVVGFWGTYFLLRVAWELVNRPSAEERLLVALLGWGAFCALYLVLAFVLFGACRVIRPATLGWGGTIAAHLGLLLVLTVGAEVVIESVRDLAEAGRAGTASGGDPATVAGVVQRLTFIEEVKAYMLVLVAGLARDFSCATPASRPRPTRWPSGRSA